MIKCKLRVILAEKEMNQKDLSIATGIDATTISNIYNERIKQIPIHAVDKMCKYFNCQVGDLFVWIDD